MNMSTILAPFAAMPLRRSLGIIITVSAMSWSFSSPSSAWFSLFLPSNEKGLVTTATVRILSSLQTSATTGAAPVPVPPPNPAVINTIWLSCKASVISSRLSIAASFPLTGSAPAPSPSVNFFPICILISALECSRACKSVLATMNLTPLRFALIILLTAFPPAPPTPITLILAEFSFSTYANDIFSPYIISLNHCFILFIIFSPPEISVFSGLCF